MFGYQVRVQETDARRPELGRTARVANIIGVLPGPRREGIGLLAHYDSRGDTPGAGDDAFGVAVSLEAARVLAASGDAAVDDLCARDRRRRRRADGGGRR